MEDDAKKLYLYCTVQNIFRHLELFSHESPYEGQTDRQSGLQQLHCVTMHAKNCPHLVKCAHILTGLGKHLLLTFNFDVAEIWKAGTLWAS